jgi:hypothetical protein
MNTDKAKEYLKENEMSNLIIKREEIGHGTTEWRTEDTYVSEAMTDFAEQDRLNFLDWYQHNYITGILEELTNEQVNQKFKEDES